jgi:hypothetical protein
MAFTLISISRLDKGGCALNIEDGLCLIKGPKPNRTIIGMVPLIKGLYHTSPSSVISPSEPRLQANAATPVSINQLHRKLGHINFKTLREMTTRNALPSIELDASSEPEFCKACVQGKASCLPFPKESQTKFTKYREKVVTDLWGPAQVQSLSGHSHYHLHHDMYSAEERVTFLKKKSEAFDSFRKYEAWLKKERNPNGIKCYGSDRGGEFTSTEFNNHLEREGMVRHITVHDSPQSNGVAERSNRKHLERT